MAQRQPAAGARETVPGAPSPTMSGIGRHQAAINQSPRMVAQRLAIESAVRGAPPTIDTAGVVQREGDDWALDSTTKMRQELDASKHGRRYAFKFDHGGANAGFGTALHHHVSRAKMSELTASYKKSQTYQSKMKRGTDKDELGAALSGFQKAIGEFGSQASLDSQDMETILHNLPMNLHYGPAIVKSDPGSAFDPSTQPRAGGNGERELEPTSAALSGFATTYQDALDQLPSDSTGALLAETWTSLTTQLRAAHALYLQHPNLVHTSHGAIAVNEEQWITTDQSDTWAKRGLNKWPSLDAAKQRFAERTAPLAAGAAGLAIHHDFTIAANGGVVTIRVGCSAADLVHFCNRHTFRHFDPGQIKLLNTFFDPGSTLVQVTAAAQQAFGFVEAELRRQLPSGVEDYEITGGLIELLASDGLTFSANAREMTVIDRDDLWAAAVDGAVQLVSLVPVGSAYDSYDAGLLASLNLP
ncbi:hypothetical protein CDN99_25075 [Roseateles aquatilis]|uniref:Uncharacterized protein n=2 Tax=Roseateles aquatilis TaxID=431061 RepID=A0A246IVA6_9BURK|nr:hypothetical protein CDN99_25075 [Roseateles aquatilis]